MSLGLKSRIEVIPQYSIFRKNIIPRWQYSQLRTNIITNHYVFLHLAFYKAIVVKSFLGKSPCIRHCNSFINEYSFSTNSNNLHNLWLNTPKTCLGLKKWGIQFLLSIQTTQMTNDKAIKVSQWVYISVKWLTL